jgi:serine/threonine protein kinase
LFVAYDAAPKSIQIKISDPDSCPQYDRWQKLRQSGSIVDFKRICNFDSGFPSLSDCLCNLSGFNKGIVLNESPTISTQIYHGCNNGISTIVKSITLLGSVKNGDLERMTENLMNLRHPCIAGVIGVVFPLSLTGVKIVRMYLSGISLSEVVSTSPEWWTPTAKAKAVVGVVLGMRFAHSLGLIHGHLTGNNIIFNESGMIQICDFCLNGFGGFSEGNWNPKGDVQAFSRILSEIVIDASDEQGWHRRGIPLFIVKMIQEGQS